MRKQKRQSGIALTVFVLIFFAISVTFVANYSIEFTSRTQSELSRNQTKYLEEVSEEVLAWYRQNSGRVDADMFVAITAASISRELGTPLRFGATLEVSNRLTAGPIRYRRIVVWLPNEDDADANPPIFDPATGAFTPCTEPPCSPRKFVTIDGSVVQNELYTQAVGQVEDLAYKAQQYFKAHYISDADKDIGINYFRSPRGDATASPDFIGNLDTYSPIGVSVLNGTVLGALSLSTEYARNPWGVAIEASNLQDSQTAEPPFSMVFRSVTPWGTPIVRYAVQPL